MVAAEPRWPEILCSAPMLVTDSASDSASITATSRQYLLMCLTCPRQTPLQATCQNRDLKVVHRLQVLTEEEDQKSGKMYSKVTRHQDKDVNMNGVLIYMRNYQSIIAI